MIKWIHSLIHKYNLYKQLKQKRDMAKMQREIEISKKQTELYTARYDLLHAKHRVKKARSQISLLDNLFNR